jgi:hypothetical protein
MEASVCHAPPPPCRAPTCDARVQARLARAHLAHVRLQAAWGGRTQLEVSKAGGVRGVVPGVWTCAQCGRDGVGVAGAQREGGRVGRV